MKQAFDVDADLLLKQKEEIFAIIMDPEKHKPNTELLEGALNLLDAVHDNLEDIHVVELSECTECGYKGNVGKWKGNVYMSDGSVKEIEGHAYLLDDHFDLDPLFKQHNIDNDEVESFDGEADCPICGSKNLYLY